jgi:hypothetical protein
MKHIFDETKVKNKMSQPILGSGKILVLFRGCRTEMELFFDKKRLKKRGGWGGPPPTVKTKRIHNEKEKKRGGWGGYPPPQ